MTPMRRLLCFVLLLALVGAGAALAARGDPQKKITRADQARAKAMLLRKADFSAVFRATPASADEGDFYCKALDGSDLTLTGEAESPTFAGGVEFVSSLSEVYRSLVDANTAWRRETSAAGEKCARDELRRQFGKQGIRLESLRRMAFPRLAPRSVAYRIVLSPQGGGRAYIDVVALQQSRGHAALLLGSALAPMPKDEEVRLARLVAGRMAKAMRDA